MAAIVAAFATAAACMTTAADPGSNSSSASRPTAPSPSTNEEPPVSPARHLAMARRRIDHVVFIVKENRTFDHLFGRFPAADGATTGLTCDGTEVPLRLATDSSPGAVHSFGAGITAINGGR